MSEETHNAAMSGSIGIIMAIGCSALLGWFLLLGLLFSIQDLDATVGTATGQPVAQIFLDTVGSKGAIVLMVRFLPLRLPRTSAPERGLERSTALRSQSAAGRATDCDFVLRRSPRTGDRDRRDVLLRHVLGDVQLAHDVRVRA